MAAVLCDPSGVEFHLHSSAMICDPSGVVQSVSWIDIDLPLTPEGS